MNFRPDIVTSQIPRSAEVSLSAPTQRIVQIHASDYGGGAEAVVRLHHEELIRQGHNSRVLVARKHGSDPRIEEIEYVRGPIGFRRLARWVEHATGRQYIYSPSFRRLMISLADQADVVHIHSLHGAEGYADLARLGWLAKRVPLVITLHDLWLFTGHCAHPLDCERWLRGCGSCPDLRRYPSVRRDGTRANWLRKHHVFRGADIRLIVPSAWVAAQVERSPVLQHLPVTVIGNPVDTRIFFPADRRTARSLLGLPRDKNIVLLTAQLLHNVYKGIPQGIAALNQVDSPNLFIVAIGRDSQEVIRNCRAPGLAVAYQSEQSALADYYRAADILLMPSHCETFGMVAAEAMACGTPVVAFAAGGLTDVLGDNESGLLVPPGDVHALKVGVESLLEDENLRHNLSRRAVERVNRQFSLPIYTRRCLEVYEGEVDRLVKKPVQ